jgi:hypothetical protein
MTRLVALLALIFVLGVSSPALAEPPAEPALGDVNCDTTINSIDAALVLQNVGGLLPSLPCPSAADVNANGTINSIDAALILQYSARIISTFHVSDNLAVWQQVESDPASGLPGEYVNLPVAFAEDGVLAHYGASSGPTTNGHVAHDVDYSAEGFPPAGGPHWGQGSCGTRPAEASPFCGPVPWGIYRDEWHPESLVHNEEHGGVIVWYNSADLGVRDQLESWASDELRSGTFVVMAPYSVLPQDTVALTAWARRDVFPTSDMTGSRVKDFIDQMSCRFNPEGFNC